jgi:hypothetical protein
VSSINRPVNLQLPNQTKNDSNSPLKIKIQSNGSKENSDSIVTVKINHSIFFENELPCEKKCENVEPTSETNQPNGRLILEAEKSSEINDYGNNNNNNNNNNASFVDEANRTIRQAEPLFLSQISISRELNKLNNRSNVKSDQSINETINLNELELLSDSLINESWIQNLVENAEIAKVADTQLQSNLTFDGLESLANKSLISHETFNRGLLNQDAILNQLDQLETSFNLESSKLIDNVEASAEFNTECKY